MLFLLPFQASNLNRWEQRGFTKEVLQGPKATDNQDRHADVIAVEPPGDPIADGPFERVAKAISEYRIFPESLATPILKRTPLQVGDTLGLRYRLFPGIHMLIGSRVIESFRELKADIWRSGFTYRTLEGHVELGEETFAVEKNRQTGEITASLTAWSRPGHWLTRIGYWYARWCQLHAGRQAIENFRRIASSSQ